ncbi:hypothetical protein OBBRIDRAFT_325943 [Obba rivulosa]|uniref:Uncharacterized protein n=1 Tax=Obba rivulosa TaxID=1052685 RepID=A0A8E2DPD3_9APHY|nr:hypothetical protein OBBRIDRAFT_325943 [Obba rivulosa]
MAPFLRTPYPKWSQFGRPRIGVFRLVASWEEPKLNQVLAILAALWKSQMINGRNAVTAWQISPSTSQNSVLVDDSYLVYPLVGVCSAKIRAVPDIDWANIWVLLVGYVVNLFLIRRIYAPGLKNPRTSDSSLVRWMYLTPIGHTPCSLCLFVCLPWCYLRHCLSGLYQG